MSMLEDGSKRVLPENKTLLATMIDAYMNEYSQCLVIGR